jgi:hypothetical protein
MATVAKGSYQTHDLFGRCGEVGQPSTGRSSLLTPRWRKPDSNHRSRVTRPSFEAGSCHFCLIPRTRKSRREREPTPRGCGAPPAEPMVRIRLPPGGESFRNSTGCRKSASSRQAVDCGAAFRQYERHIGLRPRSFSLDHWWEVPFRRGRRLERALEMLNPNMKGWGAYEFARRQAEQLRADREATSERAEPTWAPGSTEWLAEQKKSS